MAVTRTRTLSLLRRWNAGDRGALDALLAAHLPWVRERVHRRLGAELRRRAETHDLVQDTMIRFLRDGPRLEVNDDDHFRQLVGRIVENTIRDQHRHLHRHMRDLGVERPARDSVLQLDPPVDAQSRPSQLASREEDAAWVRLAIELLDPEDRDVILLREWAGLEFEEIAQRLGIGCAAARKRYQRALPLLAKKLLQLRQGRLPQALQAAGPEPGAPHGWRKADAAER